jgi:hypothetical protein
MVLKNKERGRALFWWAEWGIIVQNLQTSLFISNFINWYLCQNRPHWPRGLKCGYAAARLLWLWVRIPPGAWMSVACEYCVLQLVVSVTGRSLIQRIPTVYVCVLECHQSKDKPLHLQRISRRDPNEREIGPWQNSTCLYVLFFFLSYSLRLNGKCQCQ